MNHELADRGPGVPASAVQCVPARRLCNGPCGRAAFAARHSCIATCLRRLPGCVLRSVSDLRGIAGLVAPCVAHRRRRRRRRVGRRRDLAATSEQNKSGVPCAGVRGVETRFRPPPLSVPNTSNTFHATITAGAAEDDEREQDPSHAFGRALRAPTIRRRRSASRLGRRLIGMRGMLPGADLG